MLANQGSEQHSIALANLQVLFGGFSSAGIKGENQDAFATKGALPLTADFFHRLSTRIGLDDSLDD